MIKIRWQNHFHKPCTKIAIFDLILLHYVEVIGILQKVSEVWKAPKKIKDAIGSNGIPFQASKSYGQG